jgi:hypothetical protein
VASRLIRSRPTHDLVGKPAVLGFDEICLHHVGQDQDDFTRRLVDRVLPDLWS